MIKKYLVEVRYKNDAERKRIENVVKNTTESYRPKGYVAILPEKGVKKLLDKVPSEQVKVTSLDNEININDFSKYLIEKIELPRYCNEKLFNYFLDLLKIKKENRFLRSKKALVEIIDMEFDDEPYVDIKYRVDSLNEKNMVKKLRDSIDVYRKTIE